MYQKALIWVILCLGSRYFYSASLIACLIISCLHLVGYSTRSEAGCGTYGMDGLSKRLVRIYQHVL